jgi:DUF971 family protein
VLDSHLLLEVLWDSLWKQSTATSEWTAPTMDLTTTPNEIELRSADNTIRIYWADEHATVYRSRDLRLMCRCAGCVDETTGRPILDPATVPETIEAGNIEEVGNYGLRIEWTSGHSTGIYTWDRLRKNDPTHTEAT